MKKKEIDIIYICAKKYNNDYIASKVVVRFKDKSYSYHKLPPYLNTLVNNNRNKEIKKMEKYLSFYSNLLEKQNKFNKNHILVFEEGSKIEETIDIDNMIKKITDSNELDNLKMYKIEKKNFKLSLFETLLLGMYSNININILFPTYSLCCATYYLRKTIKNNKQRNHLKDELMISKKLKLYLSYFMLFFNLGLTTINIDYDKDRHEFSINFDKLEELKHDLINTKKYINFLVNSQENPFEDTNELLSESEKLDLLFEGLEVNPYLSDRDCNIVCSLEEFILENSYFDYESAYDNLISLKAEYYDYDRGNVAASYSTNSNLIKVYNMDELTEKKYEQCMQHELLHCIGGSLSNIALDEGMTSLIQAEYFNNGMIADAYKDHAWLTRIFCELITPEKMLEAYSENDMSIIKEEMLKINPNEEDYDKLLSVMQIFGMKFKEDNGKSISSINYFYMLSDEEDLFQIFYSLLKPYILSEKVPEEAKTRCLDYVKMIGKWDGWSDKMYFNKENIEEKNYTKTIN